MRKPIQIAVASSDSECDAVYALCSDGTIWFFPVRDGAVWTQMDSIPQDKWPAEQAVEMGAKP